MPSSVCSYQSRLGHKTGPTDPTTAGVKATFVPLPLGVPTGCALPKTSDLLSDASYRLVVFITFAATERDKLQDDWDSFKRVILRATKLEMICGMQVKDFTTQVR